MEETFSFDEKDKKKLTYLYEIMSRVLKPHPWHGIPLKFKEYSECEYNACLLYTSPSPRDRSLSRMPSSA